MRLLLLPDVAGSVPRAQTGFNFNFVHYRKVAEELLLNLEYLLISKWEFVMYICRFCEEPSAVTILHVRRSS